mmetsp:Transcript_28503/g.53830  ORF Transcript_28503/g.53830 Transcript_28503/m.53830 type:complete len:114 (+) Transcript_28503:1428-1769(+)
MGTRCHLSLLSVQVQVHMEPSRTSSLDSNRMFPNNSNNMWDMDIHCISNRTRSPEPTACPYNSSMVVLKYLISIVLQEWQWRVDQPLQPSLLPHLSPRRNAPFPAVLWTMCIL